MFSQIKKKNLFSPSISWIESWVTRNCLKLNNFTFNWHREFLVKCHALFTNLANLSIMMVITLKKIKHNEKSDIYIHISCVCYFGSKKKKKSWHPIKDSIYKITLLWKISLVNCNISYVNQTPVSVLWSRFGTCRMLHSSFGHS